MSTAGPGPDPGQAPGAGADPGPAVPERPGYALGAGGAPDPEQGAGPPAEDQRGSLRGSFGGLTTRGRSFLAAGGAAAVCAYVLGQADLLRVGLLLATLPLVCVLVLHRTRHRVTGARRLSPDRVPAHSEARVHLRIDNVSRMPTGLLMLQDRVPYVLGPRPRFVLDRVEPGGRRDVSYRVRSDLRGRFPLGPLQLRLTDPFGMCELTRSFSWYDTLTVVPQTEVLTPVRLIGQSEGYGDGRQRSLALAGDDDVIPRGYRHGDDLRRVHWRSTARHGELMVRREEQPQQPQCTVLLDTRRSGYAGSGPDSPFEWAVSGAASMCLHLLERGYSVQLLTDTGTVTPGSYAAGVGAPGGGPGSTSSETAGLLLDTLAVVEHSTEATLDRAYESLRVSTNTREGLLIAFLGELDEEQAPSVARIRRAAGRAVAFCAQPDTSAAGDSTTQDDETMPDEPGEAQEPGPRQGQGPREDLETDEAYPHGTVPDPDVDRRSVSVLREAGWLAVPGGPGMALATLWQDATTGTSVKGLGR